jgi:hypothetical protein
MVRMVKPLSGWRGVHLLVRHGKISPILTLRVKLLGRVKVRLRENHRADVTGVHIESACGRKPVMPENCAKVVRHAGQLDLDRVCIIAPKLVRRNNAGARGIQRIELMARFSVPGRLGTATAARLFWAHDIGHSPLRISKSCALIILCNRIIMKKFVCEFPRSCIAGLVGPSVDASFSLNR